MNRKLLSLSLSVSLGLSLGVVVSAEAALTTPSCLAKKLKEWGKLRNCQAIENGKALQAKPFDLAKCQTKFDLKIAKLTDQAMAAAIACRYRDNANGTVTDYDTGLQWEQKVSPGGGATDPHASGNIYTWTTAAPSFCSCPFTGCPNGTAYTGFLGRLNLHTTGALLNFACFAFHCDWRLPTIAELQGIVDLGGSCGFGSPCIDPIFGPTPTVFYWSSTTVTSAADFAWGVNFGDGGVGSPNKDLASVVRAVRNSL